MNREECVRRMKKLSKSDLEFIVAEANKLLTPPPKKEKGPYGRKSAARSFDGFCMNAFDKHHGGMNFEGNDWGD